MTVAIILKFLSISKKEILDQCYLTSFEERLQETLSFTLFDLMLSS